MRTSSFLLAVDTDQNIFVYEPISFPSDIHQSIIYAYHRKYLNIVNVWKLIFRFLKKLPVVF